LPAAAHAGIGAAAVLTTSTAGCSCVSARAAGDCASGAGCCLCAARRPSRVARACGSPCACPASCDGHIAAICAGSRHGAIAVLRPSDFSRTVTPSYTVGGGRRVATAWAGENVRRTGGGVACDGGVTLVIRRDRVGRCKRSTRSQGS
jgi:hypothetical protein